MKKLVTKILLYAGFFMLMVYGLYMVSHVVVKSNKDAKKAEELELTEAVQEEYVIEEIRFKNNDSFWDGRKYIYIDTEQGTFVLREESTKFMKMNSKKNTLNVIKSSDERNTYSNNYGYKEAIIKLSEDQINDISKKYVEVFNKNLELMDSDIRG